MPARPAGFAAAFAAAGKRGSFPSLLIVSYLAAPIASGF
jgi:hypothetical protein